MLDEKMSLEKVMFCGRVEGQGVRTYMGGNLILRACPPAWKA